MGLIGLLDVLVFSSSPCAFGEFMKCSLISIEVLGGHVDPHVVFCLLSSWLPRSCRVDCFYFEFV